MVSEPKLRPLLQITGIAAGRRCFQVREVCLKGNGRSPRRPHALLMFSGVAFRLLGLRFAVSAMYRIDDHDGSYSTEYGPNHVNPDVFRRAAREHGPERTGASTNPRLQHRGSVQTL
jgi:hypothetical protein